MNFLKFIDENQNHANFRDENNILAKNIYALAKEMYKKQKFSSWCLYSKVEIIRTIFFVV